MSDTIRFGVSMDKSLVELLDRFTALEGFPNRSEALRSVVREELIRRAGAEPGDTREVAGIVSLIYRYGTRIPQVTLSTYPSLRISANLQLHLERDVCIKVIVLQGAADEVNRWAGELLSRRGVVGRLMIAGTDEIYEALGGTFGPAASNRTEPDTADRGSAERHG